MEDEEISEVGSMGINVIVTVIFVAFFLGAIFFLKHVGLDFITSLCG